MTALLRQSTFTGEPVGRLLFICYHHTLRGSSDDACKLDDNTLIQSCNAQEAALNKSVCRDATETAVPAVSLPTKQMLTWAQQLAQAAQSGSPSNGLHGRHAQNEHVSSAVDCQQISSQLRQPQHSGELHREGLSTSTGSSDPFAFNLSAFGLTGPANNEQQPAAWAAQPGQPAASQGDPFAFDMGAFGMGQDMAAAACSQPEEIAADRAEGTAQPPRQTPAAGADPYAFDMGAFGMASTSEERPDRHSSSQSVSARAQPNTEGASAEASAGPADPFVFDMGAFGMSAATMHESDANSVRLASPQHAAAHAGNEEEVRPTAQADPFAFDMGAFGMGGMADPAQEGSRDRGREGADTSLSNLEQSGSDVPSTTALIMPETSGGSPPMGRAAASAFSSAQHRNAWRDAEQAGSGAASRHAARQDTKSSCEIAGAHSSVQSEQAQCLQRSESAAGASMSFTPPEQEVFEPLSEDEIRQLESLLLQASGAMMGRNEEGKTAGFA